MLVAKAVAVQGRGDATVSADASRNAVPFLLAADELPAAAYASAMAAVFLDQVGDSGAAVDHAVESLVILGDVDLDEIESVRASLALAGFFLRHCAFDLAVETGQRAFDGAMMIDTVPVDAVAYSTGYIAAEGGHVATDESTRNRRLAHARRAAVWLETCGQDELSRSMMGPGLAAEVALALRLPVDLAQLDAASRLYPDAPPDLVAWHLLITGMAAARHGDMHLAISLLDESVPGLTVSADNHCLVRALQTRAHAKAQTGDLAGAYADSTDLATMTRRWQIDQVGGLAGQVARRAELERSSSALRNTAERLADDIDRDLMTGVHSRRWMERHLAEIKGNDERGSVMMLDLDRFKRVNDTYGYHVGDQVLAAFGGLLAGAADDQVAVARFGGEEFAVVVRDADPGVAIAYAQRVRAIAEAFDWSQIAPDLTVTVSGGVAYGQFDDVRGLLVLADDALLDAKRRGRNRVTVRSTERVVQS